MMRIQLLCGVLLVTLFAGSVQAKDTHLINPNGSMDFSADWSNGVPLSPDTAFFDLTVPCTPEFHASVTNTDCVIDTPVTMAIPSGKTYTLSDPGTALKIGNVAFGNANLT